MRATLIALACSVVSGCAGTPARAQREGLGEPAAANPRGTLQRESIRVVWYRGNPLPPEPGPVELAATRRLVAAAADHERALLETLYPEDHELWVYATRDTDGDGVFDFRISDYLGKFLEGDTDVDGDGVDNYFDDAPFVAGERGSAPRRQPVPGHLDWASDSSKSSEMAAIQRAVFTRHRVLLVERDATFTPTLARSVADALDIVVTGEYAGGLPTLRTIATEASSLLDPEHPEGAGDFAQSFSASRSLSIYQLGIDSVAVIQLGLMVHELSHAVEVAMDYDASTADSLARDNATATPRFNDMMALYDWSIERVGDSGDEPYSLFRPHYAGPELYETRWRGLTQEEWQELVAGDIGGLQARTLEIIGFYALSNPAEWFADHVISYVYLSMIDALRDDCGAVEWQGLAAWLEKTVTAAWPEYAYANARGTRFQGKLARLFPIATASRVRLAGRYLDPARFCSRDRSAR